MTKAGEVLLVSELHGTYLSLYSIKLQESAKKLFGGAACTLLNGLIMKMCMSGAMCRCIYTNPYGLNDVALVKQSGSFSTLSTFNQSEQNCSPTIQHR